MAIAIFLIGNSTCDLLFANYTIVVYILFFYFKYNPFPEFAEKYPVDTWILHESEAFICKAFKGAAIVHYCKPLITQQMEDSGSPEGKN